MASNEGQPSEVYTLEKLHSRAGDFFASIRKLESEWKTLNDLAPQLAEFEHRIRAGEYEIAYKDVLQPIADLLSLWGHYSLVVDMGERLREHLTDTESRASNLGRLGRSYLPLGRWIEGIGALTDALALVDEIEGDEEKLALKLPLLGPLGLIKAFVAQADEGIQLLEEAVEIAKQTDDPIQTMVQRGHLGHALYTVAERYVEARDEFEEALRIFEKDLSSAQRELHRRENALQLTRLSLACFEMDVGLIGKAIGDAEKAVEIIRQTGDLWTQGGYIGQAGIMYRGVFQYEKAIEYLKEALDTAGRARDELGRAIQAGRMGSIARDQGDLAEAIDYFNVSLAIVVALKGQDDRQRVRHGRLANVFCELGQYEKAIESHKLALGIAETSDLGDVRYQLVELARVYLAWAHLASEALPEARWRFEKAIDRVKLQENYPNVPVPESWQSSDPAEPERDPEKLSRFPGELGLGTVLLREGDKVAAKAAFERAVVHIGAQLAKSATKQRRNAEAHYALVAAEAGKVVCDPDWGDESKRAELLTDARSAFLNALKTDVTPGAVRDMRRDLGLILWAGGEELSQWAGGVDGLMGKLRPVGGREEYDPWSIDSLELSEQTRNVLKAAYVYTVSQAATMDDEQLLAIDGIGDIRLQELKDSINALG